MATFGNDQFTAQHQRPGPPIRPLEPACARLIEIPSLNSDLFACETLGEQGVYRRRLGQIGKEPADPCEQPISVNAAVPIKAAEEDRMHLPRDIYVAVRFHDMVCLVRIFARDMA